MFEYVYLLQTRESLYKNENVIKIGRTAQSALSRFNSYPKGSILHTHVLCVESNRVENDIIRLFNTKYENVPMYGREYFQGDLGSMIKAFHHVVYGSYSFDDKDNGDHNALKTMQDNVQLRIKIEQLQQVNDDLQKRFDDMRQQAIHWQQQLIQLNRKKPNKTVQPDETLSQREESKNDNDQTTYHESKEVQLGKFVCEHCSYNTSIKCNYFRHLNRKKRCQQDETPVQPDETLSHDDVNGVHDDMPVNANATDNANATHIDIQSDKPKTKTRFICTDCNKNFSRAKILENHKQFCRGKLHILQCETCFKRFNSYKGKYQHKKNVKCSPPTLTTTTTTKP
jgi:hypothetical protein